MNKWNVLNSENILIDGNGHIQRYKLIVRPDSHIILNIITSIHLVFLITYNAANVAPSATPVTAA